MQGRDEPNNTSLTLQLLLYYKITRTVNIFQKNIPLRNALSSSNLVAFLYWITHTNTRRPQHVPEQTYRRISLRRNMLRSFLCPIQIRTPQATYRNKLRLFVPLKSRNDCFCLFMWHFFVSIELHIKHTLSLCHGTQYGYII